MSEVAPPKASGATRRWLQRLLYLVAALAGGALAWNWSVLESYELTSYDLRLAASAPRSRDPRIVLVTMGDESFKQIKRLDGYKERSRWPWPSTTYRDGIARVLGHGAAVVGVDMLTFDTPSAPAHRHEDEALGALFAQHPGQVVLAERYDLSAAGGGAMEEWFLPMKALRPHVGRGYVNAFRDPDGVVRRIEPLRKRMIVFEEVAFSVAVAQALRAQEGAPVTPKVEGGALHLGPARVALDAAGHVHIPFTHGDEMVRVPFWRLLTGEGYDPKVFDGAVVLFGPTALELHDQHATPLTTAGHGPTDGVEVQADMIHAMLHGSALRPAGAGTARGLGLLACLLGLLCGLVRRPAAGPLALGVAAGAYWLGAGAAMGRAGLWVEVARPLGVMVASYLAVTAARLAGEERRRQQVRTMFSAYVSGDVLEYLEENPEAFSLTGERRDVTVFFSDVQGFTDMSETVTPAVLASILNRYFTPMSDLVMVEGGYVDKYIGDCVMAVFGVPKPVEDHAVRCCRSALRQMAALAELNRELESEFGKTLRIRMGMNSGTVSAGNMGSATRFEYTVMGDVVNLASRLEGAGKTYGVRIMAGEATHEAAREHFEFRFLDLLRVKGKAQPVRVYELLGARGEVPAARLARMRRFEEGWEAYRESRWDEALACFEEILAGGEDGPSALYLERCRAYRDAPPPADWGGVHVMTSK